MRLVSWNVMHPLSNSRVNAVMDVFETVRPDLVAMQEVLVEKTEDNFKTRMTGIGLGHVLTHPHNSGRGLLVASRWKIVKLPPAYLEVPRGEAQYFRKPPFVCGEQHVARLLSVRVNREGIPFELHNVHVPYGSDRGWRKIDTFRAVSRRLAKSSGVPRILCGDFNEPREEQAGQRIITWAKYNQHAKAVNPDGWDKAVQDVFIGLREHGMQDAVRCILGEQVIQQVSYPQKGNGKPHRYDHMFASLELKPVEASYVKIPAKISDHRPLLVVFKEY